MLQSELKGISYIGKEAKEEHLIKIRDSEKNPTSQAVYQSAGRTWYVKKFNKDSSVKEALTSNYFHFLTSADCTPEVRVLFAENGEYYVMSDFAPLVELSSDNPLKNLALVLMAGEAIRDVDCMEENLKQHAVSGHAYRIDFDKSLHGLQEANQMMPLVTTLDDFGTAFPVKKFTGSLRRDDFVAATTVLLNRLDHHFPWEEWYGLCEGTDLHLLKIKELVERRIFLLANHLRGTIDYFLSYSVESLELGNEQLLEFYRLLIEEKQAEGEFLICPQRPSLLVYHHVQYLSMYGTYPKIFVDRLTQAFLRVDIHCGTMTPNNFDDFIADNFDAKTYGITRLFLPEVPSVVEDGMAEKLTAGGFFAYDERKQQSQPQLQSIEPSLIEDCGI